MKIKYEMWPSDGYSDGYKSWILYDDNNKQVAGISNDSNDKNNIVVRHIEAFEKGKGWARQLIFILLDKGIILSTGKAKYNSISTAAYKMFKDINNELNDKGLYNIEILGLADNKGKEDQPKYMDVIDKKDNYHYKWSKKNKIVKESI